MNDSINDSCVDVQNEGAISLPSNNITTSKGTTKDNHLSIDTFEEDESVKVKIKKNKLLPNFHPININEIGLRRSARTREIQNKKNSFLNSLGFIGIQETEKTIDGNTAFSAVASTSDILNQREAMNHPDKTFFAQAMIKEIKDLIKNKVWEYIPKADVPSSNKILRGV